MVRNLLFWEKGAITDLFRVLQRKIKDEIADLETDRVISVNEVDLCNLLIDKYRLEPIEIKNHYVLDPDNIDIDIRGRRDRFIPNPYGPTHIKGTAITIVVPFTGDKRLFDFRPSSYNSNPPRGDVYENELHLVYESLSLTEEDRENLKREIDKDVENIRWYVSNLAQNIENYNKELERLVKEHVSRRRQRALDERKMIANLGIPIKRRKDAPKTYTIPTERRKPKIERPKVDTEKPFEPEPAMDVAIYENVLSIAQNMTRVMECSPHSFATMKEEDIRQHFLVQLNAQYEGEGVAEAFNYEGKTDILMRYKGKNVFIAECKFWKGPKSLTDAIDQLLSYTSWRDTKTAIFVFNRNKNFSDVLRKIPEVVREHSCYKRDVESKGETIFRFRFHHRDDINRELWLTIMAFNVPSDFDRVITTKTEK